MEHFAFILSKLSFRFLANSPDLLKSFQSGHTVLCATVFFIHSSLVQGQVF